MPASDLSVAGTVQITVSNSGSAAGASAPVSLLVANPKPELSAISPAAVTAGDTVTLTLTGSYFLTGAQILWNGEALSTTVVNSTTLTAQVPPSDLTAAATVSVSASNPGPGGGQSTTSLPLLIFSGSTRMVGIPLAANDIVWDPTHGLIYASVPGANGGAGSIEAINPVTATVTAEVAAGSDPNQLAISSDDSELWVGEDDTGSIERFALPSLTSDLQFNLPMLDVSTMETALSLQAAPDNADAIAVLTHAANSYNESVMIYDDATPRPAVISNTSPGGMVSVEWGADASTLYGSGGLNGLGGLNVMAVNSAGVSLTKTDPYPVSGFYMANLNFQFDPSTGYIYGDGGGVMNPATGDLVGVFDGGTLCAVDSAQGLVFFAGQTYHQQSYGGYTIEAFDKTAYRLLGSLTIPLPGVEPGQLSTYEAGPPAHFLRWGKSGLAFITAAPSSPGYQPMLFLVDGNFVNSTATPDFTTGQGVDTLPNLIAMSPQSAVAGSDDITMTITGAGFTPGAQAYWDGPVSPPCSALQPVQTLQTNYVSATELQASIPACYLAKIGTATITVSNSASYTLSNGTIYNPLSSKQMEFEILPAGLNLTVGNLAVNGLAWDSKGGLLYAAVSSGDPQYPNSIVAINPTTGAVVKSQAVGTNPSVVRVTSDGAYLYVGFQDTSEVTRLQLPGLDAPFTWPLGVDPASGSIVANDVEPAPGASQTVAVAGNDGTVAIFDNGVARSNSLTAAASGNEVSSLQWGSDATTLYGSGRSVSATTLGDLSVMNVDASGVSLKENDPGVLTNPNQYGFFGTNLHYDPGTGYLYVDDGAVVDPTNAALEGEYNSWGFVAPDSSLNTVFILGPTYTPGFPAPSSWTDGFGLESYNQKTFAPISSISLGAFLPEGTVGPPVGFVRCGTWCLAFATNQGSASNAGSVAMLYILNDPTFVTAAP